MATVKTEDLRAEMTMLENSIHSDERQVQATEFQIDLMRKEILRKRRRLAHLRRRWKQQWND